MLNPWKILGVHRQSSDEDVRLAYLNLAKKLHPDMKKGDSAKCADVNDAYAILKNKQLRSDLISSMIMLNAECPACKGAGATFKSKGMTVRIITACKPCGGSGVILKARK